jgi:hypothetical protein
MPIVGVMGGNSLCELGTVDDVQFFFDCIGKFVVERNEAKWTVITDRLYRRYLKPEELPIAGNLLLEIEEKFKTINPKDAGLAKCLTAESRLDPSAPTLADLFTKFFQQIMKCKRSSELFFETWKKHQEVRIVISDMPRFINDKARKLEEFDKLTGEPFWKR